MKTRETKQKDLAALTESLQNSKSAMVVSFTKLTVAKDQEFRQQLREAGASYQVVKNTLARIAVKGTQFEDATESFKGVTAIAWTQNDPVVLSKAISKFMKDNADIYTFKSGVVDGKLVDLAQLTTIANLPSKEELISKLLFVLNSGAQRLVTVINAVPRDLAVVIRQIGENKPAAAAPAAEAKPAEPAVDEAAPAAEPASATEAAPDAEAGSPAEASAPTEGSEAPAEAAPVGSAAADEAPVEAAPTEGQATEAESEATAAAPDDAAEQVVEAAPEADASEAEAEEKAE